MAGNNHEFKPQFSRLDAGYGNVLLGDGQAGFQWQDFKKSGFMIDGEVKYLRKLSDKDGTTYILAALNENVPKLFTLQ